MKIKDKFKLVYEILQKEKNFSIFLLMLLVNSILIDGGSLITTIPWVMLITFFLKFRCKSSKMIAFHTLFTLFIVGMLSNKVDFTAILFVAEMASIFAGIKLYNVTKCVTDKNINKTIKIIQVIIGIILVIVGLLVNIVLFGTLSNYMKNEKTLENYIDENYVDSLKGTVFYNYKNGVYHLEMFDKNSQQIYKMYSKAGQIVLDGYKYETRKQYENDILSTLIVELNNTENLDSIKKEDIVLSFNNTEDISYDSLINLNITLNTKYENITEFNNYAYTLLNKLKQINLKYNEIVIVSKIADEDNSYYKIQIVNSVFPSSLQALEKAAYVFTEEK